MVKIDLTKELERLNRGDYNHKEETKEELTEEQILNKIKEISKHNSEIAKERELKTLSKKCDISLGILRKQLEKIEVEPEKSPAIAELNKRAGLGNTIQSEVWHLLLLKEFDKATERIVKFILDKERIYTLRDDNKAEIFIYKEGIYTPKGKSYIKEICREILGRAYTDERANHIINKIIVDTYIESEEFFRNDNLDEICVKNGVLNTKTKELTDFTPDKFFFNKIPVKYDKEKNCPKIKEFLNGVLKCPDDSKIYFEIAGSGLYREYFIEKACMLVGGGRNGKGKVLELLKRFVGAENTCSVHLNAMQYKTSAVCELHNRLFNIGGDLSSDSLKDTGMFKQLTGRDIVQVTRKYLNDLIFQNYAKHIFACNELPKVYDKSLGFWSRWILLEFPYTFVSQDEYDKAEDKSKLRIRNPNIIDEIVSDDELSGFLNEALAGLERLKKNKDFSYSKGTQEVKDFWIRNSDSFMSFCLDCLESDTESKIPKDRLRKAYLKYRKKHNVKGESDISIKITLQELFGADDQQITKYKFLGFGANETKVPDGLQRVWVGIKFKGEKEGGS